MKRNYFKRLKLAGSILLLALLALVAAFLVARTRYEKQLRAQIWTTNSPELNIASGSEGSSLPTVLLLGDSRMAQWGVPQLQGWHVVNAGTGGLTTAQILLATPGVLERVHPEVVVLQAGINDLKYLGLRPEMRPIIVSLVASNLAVIASECTNRNCKVILLETWLPGRPSLARRLVWNEAVPDGVNELNAVLQKVFTARNEIHFVNLFNEAGIEQGERLYQDTLHLKPEIYQRLTPALEKVLSQWRYAGARK